jgi:hypothetical protein
MFRKKRSTMRLRYKVVVVCVCDRGGRKSLEAI